MPSIVVAAPSDLAAETGGIVAAAGGSVVDAAIAATLTAMCTEPGVCAPGGGGYLTVWEPGSEPVTVDGYMAMPGLGSEHRVDGVTRTVEMEYGGGVTTQVGPGSIAVPGGIAALGASHQRWGSLPWSEVVDAVADCLVTGFPLPVSCHFYLGHSGHSIFSEDGASRQALYDENRLRAAGELIQVEGLVDTLRLIARQGAMTLYRGELARTVIADLTARGSLLTAQDLSSYRALLRPALVSCLDGWTVATNPPPAVGGVTLTAILRQVMASQDPLDPNRWAEAQWRAFEIRRHDLEPAHDRESAGWNALDRLPSRSAGSGSTVSIAAAGSDGTVCAATMSGGYGSGVIPTGTGLWMNNTLGELELNGLQPTPAGQRLMSNMAPTVAAGEGRRLAIGSPGADRITSALSIALTLTMTGSDLATAVEHARCHVELDRGTVAVEPGLSLDPGRFVSRPFPGRDMFFGGVTAAEVGDEGVAGHADTRRSGGVSLVHA